MDSRRILATVALLTIVLAFADFVRRGHAAWVAADVAPGTAVTSGYEEESLFAVWRAAHGQPVYGDTTRLPFASAYFNWFFYQSYAMPLRLAPRLGDAAIPRYGRLLTAAGVLIGAGALFVLFRRVLPAHWLFAAAVAAFEFFGPVVGWWGHTVRPDVWAMALEAAGVVTVLLWYRHRPLGTVLLGTTFFYFAWSFKQTFFLALGGSILFLVVRGRWPQALRLGLGVAFLIAGSVLALGPDYWLAQHQTAVTNVFFLNIGLGNVADLFRKTFPLFLLALAAFNPRLRSADPDRPSLAADTRLLGLLGLAIALPINFLVACKFGAYSNHFFPSLLMLTLAGVGAAGLNSTPRWLTGVTALAAIVLLSVVTGWRGNIDLTRKTNELGQRWATYQTLPEPRFSSDSRLNLPWLNPHSPPLVLSFNYTFDLDAGKSFEAGGVGGLIEAGYFSSLLLRPNTQDSFLSGRLTRYTRGETVGDLTVYRRTTPSSAP